MRTYSERKRYEKRRQLTYGVMLLVTGLAVAAFWLAIVSLLPR